MRIAKKILSFFLTYKILMLIESVWMYLSDRSKISNVIYSETFIKLLAKYLRCNFKRDWIGRLYGVINPLVDIDGNLDVSSMIIEIDGTKTNDMEYVKSWIYKQLMMVATLFKTENIYDYISMDLWHVGPITHDNYLIVFDITSRKYMASCFKRAALQSIVYAVVAAIVLMAV